jgi:hypothetical protein
MPDYHNRITDLEKIVDELQAKAAEAEKAGGPKLLPDTYVRFRAFVTAYAIWRDKALADGLPLLDAESDATAQKQHARWYNHYIPAATEAFRMFKDLKLEDIPSQITAESVASQESIFFDSIAGWPLARFQGEVREKLRTLEQEAAGLESKWKETIGQDERQDGQIAGLRVQVLEMFKKSVAEIRGWGPRIEEAARTSATAWEASERPSPDPSFADPTQRVVETLGSLARTLDESVRAALPMYATEQTIHEVFGNHRLAVQALLEQMTPDVVEKAYAEAVAVAESAVSRASRDSQKSDLTILLDKAKALVAPSKDKYKAAFEAFVKQFDGRYTGDVSESTIELLAEAEFFDQFWRDVESVNLPGEIRGADDEIARLTSIDLSRVTPEHRAELQAIIDKHLNEIRNKIRSLDMSVLERFKIQFWLTPREAFIDRLRRMPGFDK